MYKKAYLLLAITLVSLASKAQTTYLPLGSDGYLLLDRLETRTGRLSDSLRLGDKRESRKNVAQYVEHLLNNLSDSTDSSKYSRIDLYNMRQLLSENGEWATREDAVIPSKHPILRTFYKNQYNFFYLKSKDFFLSVNPVLNGMTTIERNTPTVAGTSSTLLYNSHDVEMRGWIGKKIGFYTLFTDNQEKLPAFVYDYAVKYNPVTKKNEHVAIPGAEYFNGVPKRSGSFDYLQAAGYIDFAAIKDKVNITFGSGKHFIGDGVTSLFLSDFSANTPFLKLRTRIWKLNYETLYLELTGQYDKSAGDAIYNHKFATMHSISYKANRWLNLGFFEGVVFDRPNVYEISYLNPVAFTIATNGFNGSGDKSIIGFSAKAIAAKHVQFYGQLMLNEFRIKELTNGKGWYGNKWGIQAGAKYFDAFGVSNLDLQGELNAVRPYSYTAQDTFDNYTNYNQPLADPLGAGYIKAIGIARYQPVKNLTFTLKMMYYIQGVDTGNANLGNNIFKAYKTAPNGQNTYGVKMINGPESRCQSLNFNISYQLFRNCFIDAGGAYRKYENVTGKYPAYTTGATVTGPLTTNYVYLGVRLNSPRRDYSIY